MKTLTFEIKFSSTFLFVKVSYNIISLGKKGNEWRNEGSTNDLLHKQVETLFEVLDFIKFDMFNWIYQELINVKTCLFGNQ